ncbi:MAG: Spx/MgsR family RNA polymerase-binding regulatory protein [Bacteroidetes bacterium]|nr:Spx/MgsR family RNA polymerase-binding regulatory protein [Bacteroidota bacterium]
MIIYGIKNCDTMKKAFAWLNEKGFEYTFHNYKTEGISKKKIEEWLKNLPINEIINTKGTTFKKLTDNEKASISDKDKAIDLVLKNTSMIKRPILESGSDLLLGFNVDVWESKLIKK